MAIDFSKTTLYEGTPEIKELKNENTRLLGFNSLLFISLIVIGTFAFIKYTQEKDSKSGDSSI